jgi:hypothetical protein
MSYTKLFLSSKERETSSASSSDFRLKLSRAISAGETYTLVYAHIPQTIYNIDAQNNSFVFNDGVERQVTLPNGFYTASTVTTALQSVMNAVSSQTFTVTLDDTTQKITLDSTGSFSVSMNSVESPLGFTSDTTLNTSHTGDTILNLERTDALFIHVNEIQETDLVRGGTTFVIPSSVNQLQVIDYNERNGYHQKITFNTPNLLLSIRLTDAENRTVDLNNSDWYFVLEQVGPKFY